MHLDATQVGSEAYPSLNPGSSTGSLVFLLWWLQERERQWVADIENTVPDHTYNPNFCQRIIACRFPTIRYTKL